MLRVKMRWSGFQGGPGYSSFYFRDFVAEGGGEWNPDNDDASAAADRVQTFGMALREYIVSGTTLQVEPDVEEVEETTGDLVDVWSAGAKAAIPAINAAGGYSAASGAVLNWKTGTVRKNRRIQGRTFLVPLGPNCYENNGTLTSTAVNAITAAGTALIDGAGSPDLGVWARPTRVKDANGNPTGEVLNDGLWAAATSVRVPDMAAVLRSRRD
jgi:hypothetical protein